MASPARLPWIWDYDIDASDFGALLKGERTIGSLDRNWAVIRLLEYAPWPDVVRLLGYRALVAGWPAWRTHLRSESRRRGLEFVVDWLPRHHPELLA